MVWPRELEVETVQVGVIIVIAVSALNVGIHTSGAGHRSTSVIAAYGSIPIAAVIVIGTGFWAPQGFYELALADGKIHIICAATIVIDLLRGRRRRIRSQSRR